MTIFEEILIEKRMYDERARDENSNQLQKCVMEAKEKEKEELEKWVECCIGWSGKRDSKFVKMWIQPLISLKNIVSAFPS